MAWTQVRVELHNETNYDPLHAAMLKEKFHQSVTYNGKSESLPPAEYISDAYTDPQLALSAAARAAATTGKKYKIALLTGEASNWRFVSTFPA